MNCVNNPLRCRILQQAFVLAFELVFSGDADLIEIIVLSLRVSLTAMVVACALGLPLGAILAVTRFPGRSAALVMINALMGLPPVVVGLIVYLHLSRAGPMGSFGLLYTPTAMIVAQVILIMPIIAALSRQVLEDLNTEYAEQFRSLSIPRKTAMVALIWDARYSLTDRRPCWVWPRHRRGWRGDYCWRQYRSPNPRHDHRYCPRDLKR